MEDMSGLEVLGGVASAAQICAYISRGVATLQAVLTELRVAPDRIRKQSSHLLKLIDILESLENLDLLEQFHIRNHIEPIYEKTCELREILAQNASSIRKNSINKYFSALRFLQKEKHISNILCALEQDKSNLLLFLTSAYGITLGELHCVIKSDCGCCYDSKMNHKKSYRSPGSRSS